MDGLNSFGISFRPTEKALDRKIGDRKMKGKRWRQKDAFLFISLPPSGIFLSKMFGLGRGCDETEKRGRNAAFRRQD
jgi:hypothetical protein